MSVRAITWAWQQPIRPAARKLVLVALADEADDAGVCWPGQLRLAAKCNITDRCVRAHLAALEADKYLRREPRFREGRRTSDLSHLSLPEDFSGDGSSNGSTNGSARNERSGRSGRNFPVGASKPSGSTPAKSSGRSKDPIGDHMRATGRWS